jgi:4-amino-4-deoxy-L-arabinose transferase-like glycosyltransferase
MQETGTSLQDSCAAVLRNHTAQWLILLAASFMVLFAGAKHSGLYGDALIYAGEARLIANSGEYATLRFGQELDHHGPLLFWLTAGAIKGLGPTPFAATLFSRLFGIGCVVLTGWLGTYFYGRNTGWFAALALATCYTFVRNTTTLRMDSAVTFGVLLALLGYFRGDKWWGPPLFFCGIALGVLAKSLPGFLPLFLAGFHALLEANLHAPWSKQSRRWLCWAWLLLVPIAWWGYLFIRYGHEVFLVYRDDFLGPDRQPTNFRRVYLFFEIYFVDFAVKYFPWIIFTGLGLGTLFRTLRHANAERGERANAALLLAWIVVVLIAGGLKPSQYQRYLLPALPAVAIVTALAVVQILRERIPLWIPGTVAFLTVTAAISFACLPIASATKTQRLMAMNDLLNYRLAPEAPVSILTLRPHRRDSGFVAPGDRGRCRFFFGREPQSITIGEVNEERKRRRVTIIVPTAAFAMLAEQIPLVALIKTDVWVLAETEPG